jgi:ABC-type transport system involved in multi-copper enzyme maturation permease subunit
MNVITAPNKLLRGFGGGRGGATEVPPSSLQAAIVLSVYSLALLALAYYLFRKRDITG